MSNKFNDALAERLFERLEELEPVMNPHQYTSRQQDLLGMLSQGQFEETQEAVIKWEQEASGPLADIARDSQLESLAEDVY